MEQNCFYLHPVTENRNHRNITQPKKCFWNARKDNTDQKGRKDLLLKVAFKLSLGVDLSLTILLLHTKSKTTFFLMCELTFTFINMDCGALFLMEK